MWICPVCSGKEQSKYKCTQCGFDEREDFIKYRTVCSVSAENFKKRQEQGANAIVEKRYSDGKYTGTCLLYTSQYLEVDLRDIPDGRMPELCEEILEYCAKGPCYLYLDHIEDLSDCMPLWELSAQAAEDKNCLTMVATAEEARTLNPVIRKLFQTYYVGLPDASDRRSYLDEMLQSRFEHPSLQGMNLLVDGTEGFNYLEMDALINQIKLQIKYRIQNHEITVEQAVNILSLIHI